MVANQRTVQQVIDLILAETPGGTLVETVDTLKAGDPDQSVTGIATTFLATYDVIHRAAEDGANFILNISKRGRLARHP